jgi:hypothetical protein
MKKWRGWISVYCQVLRSDTAICHNSNPHLALSSQTHRGLPTNALKPNKNHADGSGRWQSALNFLTLAISSTTIFLVAIRGVHTAIWQHRGKHLSAEFSNRVKSRPRHFTLKGPLLKASYIFDTRLYKCKTDKRSIV